jgi:hypothetical protein
VGEIFTLTIDVSSVDKAMNAASGDILFPTDKLQALSVSKANSIMNLWIRDPSFTNNQAGGDVHFEGVVLSRGFLGADGNLVTITFEAVAPGDAPISFSSGAVLADDGNGTNLLDSMQPGDVTIVRSATVARPPATGSVSGFAGTSTTPPGRASLASLALSELSGQDPTNPQPVFSWRIAGVVSSGTTYMVKIGDGDWFNASTIAVSNVTDEYQLPLQAPTRSTELAVVASDLAGDSTSSTISFSVAPIMSPTIGGFTRVIPASNQLFSITGTAPTGTSVKIYLQKDDTMLTYMTQTDAAGGWSVAGEKAMAAGTWKLHAQAVDARGALSMPTADYILSVNSWFNDLFSQVVDWSVIGLMIVLLLGAIILVALNIVHYIRKWRISSNREVIELESRLRDDLEKIEKDLADKGKPKEEPKEQPTLEQLKLEQPKIEEPKKEG